MARYLMLALNGPKPGVPDADYNDWYRRQIGKIRAIPGVKSATRYRAVLNKGIDKPYFAAYAVETDDIEAFKAEMNRRLHPLDPPFDTGTSLALMGEALDQQP